MKKIIHGLKEHKFFMIFIMIAILILIYRVFDYIPHIWIGISSFFSQFLTIITPITIAGVMSYILKPLVNKVDKLYLKIFYKIDKKQDARSILSEKKLNKVRLLTVLTVIVSLIIGIIVVMSFVFEPFLNSLKALIAELPAYVDMFNNFMNNLEIDPQLMGQVNLKVTDFLNTNFTNMLNTSVSAITTFISNTGVMVFNFIIAVILSVYILRDKEKIGKFFSVILELITTKSFYKKVITFAVDADKVFSGYFTGVIIDATFVGVSSFVLTAIVGNPYSVIIGVIAGVSNVIPYLGPVIGALAALILGLPSGLSVAFLGFILLMLFQQIEGNLIQPKILGDFVGISPLIVIVALLIGGGLFGVVGIILSSPIAGLISIYYKRYVEYKENLVINKIN